MNSTDIRTIKSAHRVLEILEYFDSKHRTATVMDLSRSLAYPQSSTSELLRCLTRLGYLHYDRYRRTYSPTARVALLGAWVEPKMFRGGAVLSLLDKVAESIGETVVLSTATNYVVQHLHVIEGSHDRAVVEQAGNTQSLLHSPQGRLLLSSYKDAPVRSALHRLNAEEVDHDRRVRVGEVMDELAQLRAKGWVAAPDYNEHGAGLVAVMLPLRCGAERLVLSVLASHEVIVERGEEFVAIVQEHINITWPPEQLKSERARPGLPNSLHMSFGNQAPASMPANAFHNRQALG